MCGTRFIVGIQVHQCPDDESSWESDQNSEPTIDPRQRQSGAADAFASEDNTQGGESRHDDHDVATESVVATEMDDDRDRDDSDKDEAATETVDAATDLQDVATVTTLPTIDPSEQDELLRTEQAEQDSDKTPRGCEAPLPDPDEPSAVRSPTEPGDTRPPGSPTTEVTAPSESVSAGRYRSSESPARKSFAFTQSPTIYAGAQTKSGASVFESVEARANAILAARPLKKRRTAGDAPMNDAVQAIHHPSAGSSHPPPKCEARVDDESSSSLDVAGIPKSEMPPPKTWTNAIDKSPPEMPPPKLGITPVPKPPLGPPPPAANKAAERDFAENEGPPKKKMKTHTECKADQAEPPPRKKIKIREP